MTEAERFIYGGIVFFAVFVPMLTVGMILLVNGGHWPKKSAKE